MKISTSITTHDLQEKLQRVFQLAGTKIRDIEANYPLDQGSPVFTVDGRYTSRGWTEWTQGFQYGWSILCFDATDDPQFLEIARRHTVEDMTGHLTHFGVHDHGFNNVSTYGNLLRLMNEGRIPEDRWERNFYELALKVSGCVQARRWSTGGYGYIYSFNGPQSLFADTIRSLRALSLAHQLGQTYLGEQDEAVPLLERVIRHARTTAEYIVFYGEGRDSYDVRGRVAHEALFNPSNGSFRAPNSQQGFSPFTTWTRGLSWIMLGYTEQLEWLQTLDDDELVPYGGRKEVEEMMLKAARATCDFYIENAAVDGIPYWDTGAPQLHKLGEYWNEPADPFNRYEPVDSSAAAIAAQGLLRLGRYLGKDGQSYTQAGLTVLNTLFDEPYLSTSEKHQGLILHSVYHQPNGWDQTHPGQQVPNGEASMWGDYHALEAAVYVQRLLENKPYYQFFGP